MEWTLANALGWPSAHSSQRRAYYQHLDERPLNSRSYHEANVRYFGEPLHIACRTFLEEIVRGEDPIVKRDGKPQEIADPAFKRAFDARWKDALGPIMGEIWTLGLVAVRMSREDGEIVPRVQRWGLGLDYDISVRRDLRTGQNVYRVYKLRDRHGRKIQPTVDRKTRVYDGFGYDPFPWGQINGPVVALYREDRFIDLERKFALQSDATRARPPTVTTSKWDSMEPAGDPDSEFNIYGGQDAIQESEKIKYRLNMAELRNSRLYHAEAWSAREHPFRERDFDHLRHQHEDNITPLQMGETPAVTPLPETRGDWQAMRDTHVDMVLTLYGLVRQHLFGMVGSSSRFGAAGMEQAAKNMIVVVNRARRHLSRVLTDFFRETYPSDADVEIALPLIPDDDWASMLEKYRVGLLTWDGLRKGVQASTYHDPRHLNRTRKDPPPLPPTEQPKPDSGKRKRE